MTYAGREAGSVSAWNLDTYRCSIFDENLMKAKRSGLDLLDFEL